MNKYFDSKVLIVLFLGLLAILSRFFPHPDNFSPVMAVSIFCGVFLKEKYYALLIPFMIMLASDMIIGFHSMMLFVYLSFALGVFIGFMLKNRFKAINVFFSSLAGSIVFFLLTNFAVWMFSGWYEISFAGLESCFTLALPFFRNSLLGDLIYTGVLFGSFSLVTKYILEPKKI